MRVRLRDLLSGGSSRYAPNLYLCTDKETPRTIRHTCSIMIIIKILLKYIIQDQVYLLKNIQNIKFILGFMGVFSEFNTSLKHFSIICQLLLYSKFNDSPLYLKIQNQQQYQQNFFSGFLKRRCSFSFAHKSF